MAPSFSTLRGAATPKRVLISASVVAAAASVIAAARAVAKQSARADDGEKLQSASTTSNGIGSVKTGRVAVDAVFFRRFAKILGVCVPSWGSAEVKIIAILTVMLVSRTAFSVIIAEIVGGNAQAIVENNLPRLFMGLWNFALMTIPSAAVNSLIKYLSAQLNLRFRQRLTAHVHAQYIRGASVYNAVNGLGDEGYSADNIIKNADQRVTADIEQFAASSSSLYSTMFKPLLDVILFTSRLVSINGPLLPGLMFGYFALSSYVKKVVMPPIGKLTAHGSELEGSYRTAHQRIIHNAEEIAFFGGAEKEQQIINLLFDRLFGHQQRMAFLTFTVGVFDGLVIKYWASIVGYMALMATFALKPPKATSDFTKDYVRNISYLTSLTVAVGQLVLVGNNVTQLAGYTSRVSELLEIVRRLDKSGTGAFKIKDQANDSASAAAAKSDTEGVTDDEDRYERPTRGQVFGDQELAWIHSWRDRMDKLKSAVALKTADEATRHTPVVATSFASTEPIDVEAIRRRHVGGTVIEGDHIEFHDVDIVNPEGRLLVQHVNFEVPRGVNVMVTGPNGAGKSSLFRVIGDLWPLACGTLMKPPATEFLFLPQRPYLVLGTLRDQIIYPHSRAKAEQRGVTDDDLVKLLDIVDPNRVVLSQHNLDDRRDWFSVLGGGLKQRVALARLFYHKPTFAILDECTSAVNEVTEDKVYRACREMGITLFTVSHRKSHRKYHDFECHFDGRGGYDWIEIPH